MTQPDPEARGPHSSQSASDRASARRSTNGYDPLRDLKAAAGNIGEVGTYARQFISAKVSGILYGLRKLALLSMLGAVVGIAGISFLVTCAVLLVLGIADGVEALLPPRLDWLGKLLVGFGGVLLSMIAVYIVLRRAAAIGKRMAVEQYRTALREQRKQFGRDAFSRSVADAAEQHLRARQAPTRTSAEIEALRQKQVEAEKAEQLVRDDFSRIKGR